MGASYFSGPNFLDVGQIELGEEANLGTLRRISPMVATNEQQVAALAPSSSAAPITSIGAGTEPTIFDVVKKEFGSAKPRGDFSIDVAPFERESRLQPIIDPIDEEFEENFGGVIFDPGLDFDPSGRTDPDSPNFDPVAVGQNVLGEIFASPEDPTPQSILDLATDRNTSARSISQALQQNLQKGQQGFNIFSKTNEFISKALGLPTIDEKKSDAIQRAILGAAEAERQREQYAGRASTPDAVFNPVDRTTPEFTGPDVEPAPTSPAAGSDGFEGDFDPPAPAPAPPLDFNPLDFKDGGQVPSFMDMRK
tara:strand:- start:16 stop:942 length:927 start_codon:yes stop_codon:yes gene_type:complete